MTRLTREVAILASGWADDERVEAEDFYMGVAQLLRLRSTCLRGRVGIVAIRDKRIVATGYNGSPAGQPHCFELGCDVDENLHVLGCQRAIHAEANLVSFAARHGIALEGTILYCTHGPCLKCAQLIVASGITELVYETPYRLPEGLELVDRSNIPIRRFGDNSDYMDQVPYKR